MNIKIFEMVCWGGSKVAPIVDEALEKLGYDYDFDIISDIQNIAKAGITKPPAIVVNGGIIVEGYIPSVEELVNKLKEI